ncbi:tetratricopeptide repeat protein [Thalassotalea litorea]|uniref:tetratricopeptide repeat protein n=1 Tax=Thalassotalea litorea TaxID=2020715 RepID=UPI003736F47E
MRFFYLSLLLCFTVLSGQALATNIGPCMTEPCKIYFKEYKKYAKKGYADAHSGLGEMYYHGFGTEPDTNSAIRSFKRGAKYGSQTAAYKLGYIYLTDSSIKDLDNAVKYLKMAARDNHRESMYILAVIHSDDSYGIRDYDETDKWLTKAYKHNHLRSRLFISHLSNQSSFNETNFPDIYEIVSKYTKPIEKTNIAADDKASTLATTQIAWPENEMEVVEVSSPNLQDLLNNEIQHFRSTRPDKYNTGTGTRIVGRTCEEIMSCGSADKSEFRNLIGVMPFADGLVSGSP